MSNNLDDIDDKNYDNIHNSETIDSKNDNYSPDSNIVEYESSSFQFQIATNPPLITNFFKELLQELYIILLNVDTVYDIGQLSEIINNYLCDHDLDPENVFEIMTSSQNIFNYSSLIGFFYQHGIGCEVNKTKALEIFSNAVKNNQKTVLDQSFFDQKYATITFHNDEIEKLNEIITQYFYSLLLYKDIILDRKYIYNLHIKNAEMGDLTSQYYIGNCYYYGENIIHDYNKAIEWYSKSSEGGNIKAMYMLGLCYDYGYGVMKDKKKAFEFYLKSAEGGYEYASSMVGDCYHYGIGILEDKSEAFKWYLRAAEKGHNQNTVANYYNDGKYIPKDEEKRFYWNRKAAIYGEINAQFKLAEYYLDNPINKNESKAFKWYLKLANKNELRAIYLVAKCYRDGIGIDSNVGEAIEWFEKYILDSYENSPITLDDFLNGSDISD